MNIINDNLLRANLSIKWSKFNTMLDHDEDGSEFNTHPRQLEYIEHILSRQRTKDYFANWEKQLGRKI